MLIIPIIFKHYPIFFFFGMNIPVSPKKYTPCRAAARKGVYLSALPAGEHVSHHIAAKMASSSSLE